MNLNKSNILSNLIKVSFIFMLFSFCINANALATADPIVTLQNITDKVLITLKQNKDEIDKNPDKIYNIVNKVIVPHIDFQEISKWITGKKIWTTSSAIDRNNFVSELRRVVVKTYAISLHNYSDEKLYFYPLKGYNKTLRKRMQIASKIVSKQRKQDIHIDFRIISAGNTWKVYDLVVEGVSLLKGLQAQYTNLIKKEGLNSVTEKMRNSGLNLKNDAFAKKLKNISSNAELIFLKSNEGNN